MVSVQLTDSAPRSVTAGGYHFTRGQVQQVSAARLEEILAIRTGHGDPVFEVVAVEPESVSPEPVTHRYRDHLGIEREERLQPRTGGTGKRSQPRSIGTARPPTPAWIGALIPEVEMPPFTVVIPAYGKANLTERCIRAVRETTTGAHIICVDDGSVEPLEFSSDLAVQIIRLEENSGFSRAVNAGVAAAETPFVVLLNNDFDVAPDGIRRMLSALRDPSIAIAGPEGKELPAGIRDAGKRAGEIDYIEMSCCAFRKVVWEKVGPLDAETFGRGYYEDVDWCRRAVKLGYRLRAVDTCGQHDGGATFGRSPETLQMLYANQAKYLGKHRRGRAVLVYAALGCNGGGKVGKHMADALREDGWDVSICSFMPWETAGMDFGPVGKLTAKTISGEWDLAISTFHSTMPFVRDLPAKHRFALIQSDEPEWYGDPHSKQNFRTEGFDGHIIIADHMQVFGEKYGHKIVGQIDNGVDTTVFYPTWFFEREWPHRIMVIRKGAKVWFAGQEYAEEAIGVLARKYPDFGVVVLGGGKPNWPCEVQHVKTYDESEINDLYNSVSAVVTPSLIEGRSLVPLEAMAAGCPVISTRVGMDYVVDGKSALLVNYKDSGSIVDAVTRVFEESQLRESMAREGLKLAYKYTWQNEKKQFIDIINRAMGEL